MPDLIHTETYVHHTLQKSLQLPQILSPCPPPRINKTENEITNKYKAYSREASLNLTPTATLTRYSNNNTPQIPRDHYNTSTLRFGTRIDDEMNDAYYTYTAKKAKTPNATTFN